MKRSRSMRLTLVLSITMLLRFSNASAKAFASLARVRSTSREILTYPGGKLAAAKVLFPLPGIPISSFIWGWVSGKSITVSHLHSLFPPFRVHDWYEAKPDGFMFIIYRLVF